MLRRPSELNVTLGLEGLCPAKYAIGREKMKSRLFLQIDSSLRCQETNPIFIVITNLALSSLWDCFFAVSHCYTVYIAIW